MGILDSKTRILDTIVTIEGRRQIARGKLRAEFYSFTDTGAFYVQDTALSGAVEAGNRIYLEAASLPQDTITFESDDAGKLVQFPNSLNTVRNGQILSASITGSTGTGKVYEPASGDVFSGMLDDLLSGSLDSFSKCQIIGSPDVFDETRASFLLTQNSLKFWVTDMRPISPDQIQIGNVETTDPLFTDARLSHLPNFQYLPPINKYRVGDNTVNLLGFYPNLNQRPILEMADVEKEIDKAASQGYLQEVDFVETSKTNNLVCQFFEIGTNEISKLDVIDFGIFNVQGDDITLAERRRQEVDPRNRPSLSKHVFFAGKVFTDSQGVHKFVNLFTIVFK